jgi:hypothetical protein
VLAALGVLVTFAGVIPALQGVGVIGGGFVPGTTLPAVACPVGRWRAGPYPPLQGVGVLGGGFVPYCPVARHWSLGVPVRDADLTEGERQFARAHHDVGIP